MPLAVKSSLEHDGQGADLLEPERSDGEGRGYIENMRFGIRCQITGIGASNLKPSMSLPDENRISCDARCILPTPSGRTRGSGSVPDAMERIDNTLGAAGLLR
jgi:hypothetical protein